MASNIILLCHFSVPLSLGPLLRGDLLLSYGEKDWSCASHPPSVSHCPSSGDTMNRAFLPMPYAHRDAACFARALCPQRGSSASADGHQAGRRMGVGMKGLCGRPEPDSEGGGTPASLLSLKTQVGLIWGNWALLLPAPPQAWRHSDASAACHEPAWGQTEVNE